MTNYTIMQANDTDSTALKFKARKTDKLEISQKSPCNSKGNGV